MFIGYLIALFASVSIVSAAVAAPASANAVQNETAHAITVSGTVSYNPFATSFVATFPVNDITYTLTGTSSLPLTPTEQTDAKLTFTDRSQLSGVQPLQGTEGPLAVTLNLAAGAIVSWNLLPPIFIPISISGSGTWTSS